MAIEKIDDSSFKETIDVVINVFEIKNKLEQLYSDRDEIQQALNAVNGQIQGLVVKLKSASDVGVKDADVKK